MDEEIYLGEDVVIEEETIPKKKGTTPIKKLEEEEELESNSSFLSDTFKPDNSNDTSFVNSEVIENEEIGEQQTLDKKYIKSTKDILTEKEIFSYIGISKLVLNKMARLYYPLSNPYYSIANAGFTKYSNKVIKAIYEHLELSEEEISMMDNLVQHGLKPEDFAHCFTDDKKRHLAIVKSISNNTTTSNHDSNEGIILTEGEEVKEIKLVMKNETQENNGIYIDIRFSIVLDLFLLLSKEDIYDSRSRTFLFMVAQVLGLTRLETLKQEKQISEQMMKVEVAETLTHDKESKIRNKGDIKKRIALMGLATIGGSLIIGLSAGILAPVIGTGLGAAFTGIGVAGTSAFLHGVGGVAIITTSGVLLGGGLAGTKMKNRTKGISTFEFVPLVDNKRANVIITVAGWLPSQNNDVALPFSTLDEVEGDHFSLFWEPETLKELGSALKLFAGEVLGFATQEILKHTLLSTLMAALSWPLALTKLGYLVDNPWSTGLDRAEKAGLVLADVLLNHAQGYRPVSLVGYSLGARVIFYCLLELARVKAFGIVENVYLFGTPVTASSIQWSQANSIVSGELVNAYVKSDWILGFLYRASSASIAIAGLQPIILDLDAKVSKGITKINGVEVTQDTQLKQRIRNIDVTHLVSGHLAYRKLMPKLMIEAAGFNVTQDFFLDPEDIEDDPDAGTEVQVSDQLEAMMGPNAPKNKAPTKGNSFINRFNPNKKEFLFSKKNLTLNKLRKQGRSSSQPQIELNEELRNNDKFVDYCNRDPDILNLMITDKTDLQFNKKETESLHSSIDEVPRPSLDKKHKSKNSLPYNDDFERNLSMDNSNNLFVDNVDPLLVSQNSLEKAVVSSHKKDKSR